ncbi:MAG: NPCBM/NEW2 domain-containing protein [Planctomycetaceae bacterium]
MKALTLLILLTIPVAVVAQTDTMTKVSLLDGTLHQGTLAQMSPDDLELQVDASVVKLSMSDIMLIDFPDTKFVVSDEPQVVGFWDGSQLHCSGASRTAMELTVFSATLGELRIANKHVRSIRLQADNPAYRSQWNTFLKRETDKDLLIVAKRDGSGLDFLAGVVSAVGSEKTEFLLDGETVPVPAARVYGVVFASTTSKESAPAVDLVSAAKVTSHNGDQIAASNVRFSNGSFEIETNWGQSLQVSSALIRSVDLSSGRVQYLSDLDPLEERLDGIDPEGSLLAGLIGKEEEVLLFGPRRDTTMERTARLKLRGREFSKGLCIHSRTEISWALDQKYTSLDCQVGIDDEVAFSGRHIVALKITGDGKVLFEKNIVTTDEPLPLQVPLSGVSTLMILVDFGDEESTCDWLDLADAKLLIAKDKQE